MTMNDPLTFWHAPNTRSTAVFVLLEELAIPYRLNALDMKAGEQRGPAYLAINPMGKVPAVIHGGALITELVALFIYLPELAPASGLAPAIGDPLRGPWLRWLAFYGSCFEPALMDRALGREGGAPQSSPYGDFDTMWRTLHAQFVQGPYILGERFTSADVLWGLALHWTSQSDLTPQSPEVEAYVERITSRPSVVRVQARDAELAALQTPDIHA